MIIATAKPAMDATNAAASRPSGTSPRSGDTTKSTNDPDDQPEPSEKTEQTDVEEQTEPLVVEDRGVAQRDCRIAGLSGAHTLPEERPAHAVDDPRHEVGAPTDESRITCERAL